MNKKQKAVMILGILIIVGMGFYPPWYFEVTYSQNDSRFRFDREDYAFLFSSPSYLGKGLEHPRIDFERLIFQWFLVSILTGTFVFILRKKT